MVHTGHEHELDLDTSLEFINTLEHSEGGDRDDLPTLEAALDWLVGHGAMHPEAAAMETGREDRAARLAGLLGVREAMRDVVDAAVAGRPPAPASLDMVNRTLRAEPAPELVATADGVVEAHRHAPDAVADALSRVARPLADALAEGRPDRLRVCANDACRWVFYDTSRTGRRRWCDMSSCGNRAKARRHRARLRGGAA